MPSSLLSIMMSGAARSSLCARCRPHLCRPVASLSPTSPHAVFPSLSLRLRRPVYPRCRPASSLFCCYCQQHFGCDAEAKQSGSATDLWQWLSPRGAVVPARPNVKCELEVRPGMKTVTMAARQGVNWKQMRSGSLGGSEKNSRAIRELSQCSWQVRSQNFAPEWPRNIFSYVRYFEPNSFHAACISCRSSAESILSSINWNVQGGAMAPVTLPLATANIPGSGILWKAASAYLQRQQWCLNKHLKITSLDYHAPSSRSGLWQIHKQLWLV